MKNTQLLQLGPSSSDTQGRRGGGGGIITLDKRCGICLGGRGTVSRQRKPGRKRASKGLRSKGGST